MSLIATTVRGLAVAGLAGTSLMLVAPAAQARPQCVGGGVSKTVVDGVMTYRNDPGCGVDPNRRTTRPPAPKPPKKTTTDRCLDGIVGDIACGRVPGGRSVYLVPGGGTVTVGPTVGIIPGGGSNVNPTVTVGPVSGRTVNPTVTVGPTSNPDEDAKKKPATTSSK